MTKAVRPIRNKSGQGPAQRPPPMTDLPRETTWPGKRLTRDQAFWILNCCGWLLLASVDVLLGHANQLTNVSVMMFHLAYFCLGFMVSIPMRQAYRHIYRWELSPWLSGVLVIVTCLLAAHLWGAGVALFRVAAYGSVTPISISLIFGHDLLDYLRELWNQFFRCLIWSILYFAVCIWLDYRRARQRTEKAERLARQAQLEALRYQINPHFLFNALNSVRAMIIESPEVARGMVTDIASFFRHTLSRTDQFTIPLREEMAVVTSYLAIEKRRFEDRLQVRVEVTPDAADTLIPCFMIQPLVENAIKHGLKSNPGVLTVAIVCSRKGNELDITVVNSGEWLPPARGGENGTGSGIENLRERLAHIYGHRQQLDTEHGDGEVRVVIHIKDPENQGG